MRFYLLCATLAMTGCAWIAPDPEPIHVKPEWRFVPEATVIGQRRQFFLYGRHLDSARLAAPPSVLLERGALNEGGRVLTVYLTVKGVNPDSLARGESVGLREVDVKTPDTSVTFKFKVVDEAVQR